LANLTVRLASEADSDSLFGLLKKFATSYQPQPAAFDVNYPRVLQKEESDLLVAEQEGRVVGYLLASDALILFANGVVTELLELYVDEDERRRGIGRRLVQQAVARAKERGAVEVTVPTRRAADFYLALGFESTAEFFKLRLRP